MSDFIFWNIIFGIVWCLWLIVKRLLPKSTVFAVVSRGRSAIHGQHAVVLVNEKRIDVFRTGPLWRFKTTGHVLPPGWQDILNAPPET